MPLLNELQQTSIDLHRKLKGKIQITSKQPIHDRNDLSLVYTPGVGAVSSLIAEHPEETDHLTWRKNAVAVISDGSAVLGLGNIGPDAALPVMEGKCAIFKEFAKIDAVPIVLATQDQEEIIKICVALAPSFGALQLEDISAPRCFEIERRVQEALAIPVMHDDQHGTAIVVLASLWNATKVVGKQLEDCHVVLNGAGAAGTAIAKLLINAGVQHLVVVDRTGAIYVGRNDLNGEKQALAELTNHKRQIGLLPDVTKGADILIGVSVAGAFSSDLIKTMARDPIVIALANPVPEIMPDMAKAAGVAILATGRSDFANQVNNALCYPGLFRGMLDHGVKKVTDKIKLRAARAIASMIMESTAECIIPSLFEKGLMEAVAASVID